MLKFIQWFYECCNKKIIYEILFKIEISGYNSLDQKERRIINHWKSNVTNPKLIKGMKTKRYFDHVANSSEPIYYGDSKFFMQ